MKSNTPMGCKDLKKKWHQSTLNDMKRLKLPTPDHEYGFSSRLLAKTLPADEYTKFCKWMFGQTCMIDEILGMINYTYDVIRGIDYIRHGKPTYWD